MQSSSRSRRNEESFLERVSRKDRTPRLQDDQNDTSVQSLKQPSLRQIASSVTSRSNKQRLNRQESAVDMRRSQDPNASITLSRILLETSMQQSERGANNNAQNGVNPNHMTDLQLHKAYTSQGYTGHPVNVQQKL